MYFLKLYDSISQMHIIKKNVQTNKNPVGRKLQIKDTLLHVVTITPQKLISNPKRQYMSSAKL